MKIKRTLPSIKSMLGENIEMPEPNFVKTPSGLRETAQHINVVQQSDKVEENQIINRLANIDTMRIFKKNQRSRSKISINDYESSQQARSKRIVSNQSLERARSQLSFKQLGNEENNSLKESHPKSQNPLQHESGENLVHHHAKQSYSDIATKNERKRIFSEKKTDRSHSEREGERRSVKVDSNKDLLDKINNLETIVKDLSRKIPDFQPQQSFSQSFSHQQQPFSPTISSLKTSFQSSASKQMETRKLELQLQQMKRCEKIAKENEQLYSYLVSSLNNTRDHIEFRRPESMRFQDLERSSSRISHVNEGNEEWNLDITSPFLLEENSPSAFFSVKGHPIHK